ncbi:MAG TPA: hypothetical protein VGL29_10470 [Blastocatellia bacterium]
MGKQIRITGVIVVGVEVENAYRWTGAVLPLVMASVRVVVVLKGYIIHTLSATAASAISYTPAARMNVTVPKIALAAAAEAEVVDYAENSQIALTELAGTILFATVFGALARY